MKRRRKSHIRDDEEEEIRTLISDYATEQQSENRNRADLATEQQSENRAGKSKSTFFSLFFIWLLPLCDLLNKIETLQCRNYSTRCCCKPSLSGNVLFFRTKSIKFVSLDHGGFDKDFLFLFQFQEPEEEL